MAQFRGTVRGNKGGTSRLGTKNSVLEFLLTLGILAPMPNWIMLTAKMSLA